MPGFNGFIAAPGTLPFSVAALQVPVALSRRVSNADKGRWLRCTAGVTLTWPRGNELDSDFFCFVENAAGGTNAVTLTPTGTTAIDSRATGYLMYPSEVRRFDRASKTSITSKVLATFRLTYTVTQAAWIVPPGYSDYQGFLWSGGAAGGRDATNGGAGGGGGNCLPFFSPASAWGTSIAITIATAVAGRATNGVGTSGNNSSVGTLFTSYGGYGGNTGSASNNGGGGGGALGAAVSNTGGAPGSGTNGGLGGGYSSSASTGGEGGFGGGAGGYNTNVGGNAVYGGAGGGGGKTPAYAGGSSYFGGNGGIGSVAGTAGDGAAPAGGGGGTTSGTSGGGARGEIRFWGIPA